MKEYKGNTTANARIRIDYSEKKKPVVSFSYPSKKHQFHGSMFPTILFFFTLISLVFYEGFNLGSGNAANPLTATNPLLAVSSIFFLLFVFPLIASSMIYYPFKDFWSNIYPRYQAMLARKKLAIFKSKDVIENENGIYCEIPVFTNIVMDYKANKDFAKYLNLFEIKEHKFVYYRKRPKKMNPKRFADWKRKTINEWVWYARFYFKQKPIKGKLEVLFK